MSSLYEGYVAALRETLGALDLAALSRIEGAIAELFLTDRLLLIAGNGGSAATASHMACDFGKTTLGRQPAGARKRLRAIALSDCAATLTAYGNDVGYDSVFAEQVKTLARPGDGFLAISASGNSPNIVRALEAARQCGATTVALLGFDGGQALGLADFALVVASTDYGIVEDAHSVAMHMLTQRLREVVAAHQTDR